jgi:hypothetical protein
MTKRLIPVCTVVGLLLLAAARSSGEVKTVWQRNEPGAATTAFKFEGVPAPSKASEATDARLAVVEGIVDSASGGLEVLNDGQLPTERDQPERNFFFAQGSDGGRLLVDLGAAAELKRVNTYSWHPGTRGPQVYRLLASDGSAENFVAKPKKSTDPEKSGWTRIASIDTRPKQGKPGGQYGVSIFDPAGSLGKYRYLLFDISRTEADDQFGNTFFSRIDIDDGQPHAAKPLSLSVAQWGQYEILFETTETPELAPWVDTTLKPVCRNWYPIIVRMLPSEGYQAPRRFTVTFRKQMNGVAYTAGTRIVCAADWFGKHLKDEAAGAVVHEMVHVVQQYSRTRGGSRNPGWLVEGIADYVRWFNYAPPSRRPHPDPERAKYTDSYRTTAAFLDYVTENCDKNLVEKLNAAMRQGKYAPELWKTYTGKTAEELWADYIKTLKTRKTAEPLIGVRP